MQNIITTTAAMTMSSREIAELTGKQHKHVLNDIRGMLSELGQTSAEFSADVLDSYGRLQPGFSLPKRETLILISGYSVEMRARIIDRWQELEAQVAQPASAALPSPAVEAVQIAEAFANMLRLEGSARLGLARSVAGIVAPHLLPALPAAPRE